MRVLSDRMTDPVGKNYRHVLKGLQLLRHLMVHSHTDYVVAEVRANLNGLRNLTAFEYIDEHLIDRGEEIRRLAEYIVNLARDNERLNLFRKQAQHKRFLGFPPLTQPSKWSQKVDDWECLGPVITVPVKQQESVNPSVVYEKQSVAEVPPISTSKEEVPKPSAKSPSMIDFD